MGTEKKKLSLADLIAKKTEKEKNRHKSEPFYVESLGGEVTLESPGEDVILKALDMFEDNSLSGVMEAYIYLIYNSVALLRNTELHAEYDVVDPLDVVPKLLDMNERLAMGEAILNMTKINKMGEKIKN